MKPWTEARNNKYMKYHSKLAYVIIIIKSEVSTSAIIIIFPWLCAWDICYTIFCHLLHIHSGKIRIFFSLLLCSLWRVQIVGYVFVCLYITPSHYRHCANLSEDIVLIKCLSYIFCRACVRLSIFSQLSIIQYMGLCVFSLPISLVMIERIYILCLIIIIKYEILWTSSEVWTIIHCLGFGHETMVWVVCLPIFLRHN